MELVFQFPETKIENKKLLISGRPSSFRIYQKRFYPFSSLRDLCNQNFWNFWSQSQKDTIFNCTNQRFPETKIENKKLLISGRPSSFRIYQKLFYPFISLWNLCSEKNTFFWQKNVKLYEIACTRLKRGGVLLIIPRYRYGLARNI